MTARSILATVLATAVLAATFGVPVRAATPYDGVYRGGNTLNGGGGTRCPTELKFNIVVKDGEFTWVLGSERETVKVGPDGSFSGRSGMRFISGRIEGRTMTASTSGGTCNYLWSLSK